jgi:hypothetical protein
MAEPDGVRQKLSVLSQTPLIRIVPMLELLREGRFLN